MAGRRGAGLARGDVVLRIDGEPVRDRAALVDRIRAHHPATASACCTGANGASAAPRSTGAERGFDPERLVSACRAGYERRLGSGGRGSHRRRRHDADLARYFAAPRGDCVLVTRVHDGGPAARAGLRAGDLCVRTGWTAGARRRGLRHCSQPTRSDSCLEVWRRDHAGLSGAPRPPSWLRRAPRTRAGAIRRTGGPAARAAHAQAGAGRSRREVDLLRRRR